MTDATPTTTITVTVAIGGREYIRQVEGTHWARDENRTLYVYDDDRTLLEVEAEHVVEVLREADVQTAVTLPTDGDNDLGAIDAESTTTTESD
jgi:hypothetical protein